MLGSIPYEIELNQQFSKIHRLKNFFPAELQDEDPHFGNFLDLLNKMLVYNPIFRITPERALSHSFFTEVKLGIKENSLRSPNNYKHQSSNSSMNNSPSSKLSTGIDSCCILSPLRQGSYTVQEETLLKIINDMPRRTSLQDRKDSCILFLKTRRE